MVHIVFTKNIFEIKLSEVVKSCNTAALNKNLKIILGPSGLMCYKNEGSLTLSQSVEYCLSLGEREMLNVCIVVCGNFVLVLSTTECYCQAHEKVPLLLYPEVEHARTNRKLVL